MSPRRARKLGWNAVGIGFFALMVFPVFWMIATAFKTEDQINSLTPTWFSGHPTLRHFRDAIVKPFFWADVKNTVIVVLVSVGIAMVLRGFLLGIPKELEEAAMVDGSSRLGAFVRILLPLVAPGLVATSVFAFITSWNEYIFARILLNDQAKQTITVWLSYYTGTSRATDWGGLMAASTLIAIPVVIFFLVVQRRIAFGLTAGAVRG